MYKHLKTLIVAALIPLLFGCAPSTLSKAEKDGKSALAARQIYDLIWGNSMQLTASDFTGQVYFDTDGRLGGDDYSGNQDTGFWDITDDNRLCLKFRLWYYGDLNCYSLVPGPQSDTYLFFTLNGAAYYTATLKQGDVAGLATEIKKKSESEKPSRYLRKEFAAGGVIEQTDTSAQKQPDSRPETSKTPAASQTTADTATSVRRLARNCPGCNLAGADLKEIELVKANLAGADLSRADLRYSNLRRANLAGADLSSARLNFANLPGADMRGCILRNADLSGANLLLADLTGADLTGAILDNAHIDNTKGLEK